MRRLPAEWEPQSGVMLTWPHADTGWARQLDRVERLYTELAALIARLEPVLIACRDDAQAAHVRRLLGTAGADPARLRLGIAPSNDTWVRDYGPITPLDDTGAPILVDFRFNGWGGKFPSAIDNRITERLHASGTFGAIQREAADLVLEGGAIDTDGRGTLLAVTRTLVDPRRNPGRSRTEIECELADRLGIRHFLWLEHGLISGDDTEGHIDTLARFGNPHTICYTRCEDSRDVDHAGLERMERELAALRDPDGNPYRLVPLPSPRPVVDADGRRLPAGYANFLVINGAVLLPVYQDPADARAQKILGTLFPGRTVLPLDCRPLIRQGGSLHCISMQLPPGVLPGKTQSSG